MTHTKKSELEELFDAYWRICSRDCDVPAPEIEVKFHPTRKWRFDRAWLAEKVAVEIDGGTFSGGRHVRGMGYHRQIEKMNQAQAMGWVVLRYDTKHIHDDPQAMVDEIVGVLKGRG